MSALKMILLSLLLLTDSVHAAPAPASAAVTVQSFSPQGEIKAVRQVSARFSEAMVAFGDPRLEAPFEIACPVAGNGHWADGRNWLYDFDADLPAGLKCTFTPKPAFKSLTGVALEAKSFSFTTGGPAIQISHPYEGYGAIDEEQVFLLGLDALVDMDSVKKHAACSITGVGDRIPLKIIEGSQREKILAEQAGRASNFFQVLTKNARVGILEVKDNRLKNANVIVAQCDRKLPAGSRLTLWWDKGITSTSGIASSRVQSLQFAVREAFKVSVNCTRTNPKAGCVPVLPITVSFTAPVARELASKLLLKTADGKQIAPVIAKDDTGKTVAAVSFRGPFSEKTSVSLSLPYGFKDDADRTPVNAAAFPVKLNIAEDPPLIKFPSRFGILEQHAQPALPVSVRNVEATLTGVQLQSAPSAEMAAKTSRGMLGRLALDDDATLAEWFFRVTRHPYDNQLDRQFEQQHKRYPREGEIPLLMDTANNVGFTTSPLQLPRAHGDKTFELIGVPLKKPGFYVVEFASDRLGATLHGEQKPYYVSSSALVTNMAVHLKQGRESSLVWVTRLDNAQPVSNAAVRVSTCEGRTLWEGKTDGKGMAHIAETLPEAYYNQCSGLLATARKGDDLSFVFSSWDDGISPWQFNLGGGSGGTPLIAHTVFDRPLFRAGEKVSMKHFIRVRTGKGFALAEQQPDSISIVHGGSGEKYDVAVTWSGTAGLSTWAIPKEAKLGTYAVSMMVGQQMFSSGTFRVEQYRVPLMKAVLKAPAQPLVNGNQLVIDAQLNYLAGGAAAGAPVKFRSRLVRYPLQYSEFEDFSFGGRLPKEGIEAVQPYSYDPEMEYDGESVTEDASAQVNGYPAKTVSLSLDGNGGARVTFDKLPRVQESHALEVEMEYTDPNGQILNTATQAMVLPAALSLGIKIEGFFATKERLAFKVLAVDAAGQAWADRKVNIEAYTRKTYAYRKRMLGGFYAYEQTAEVKKAGNVCSGTTDKRGMLVCDGAAPESGEIILVATAQDKQGNIAVASSEVYVADDNTWFDASQSDRIDLLADKRAYEPGETARFEVRMPFRKATALVTVEREGILDSFVVPVSASSPFVKVPIAGNYGPNAYVSVMVVRGRIDPEVSGQFSWLKRMMYRVGIFFGLVKKMPAEIDTRPTALVDLTKPAFKLGMTQIRVGWQAYSLKVKVEPDRQAYHVRDKARVKLTVTDPAGKPAANAEVALAAVDEGLLQLARPQSWNLLETMMERRALEVRTSTAQSQVIGKRHFGKKAVAPGGGGGQGANARELFDTLLLWKPSLKLDARGQAVVDVPLNDSLTSFRIAAIAHAGSSRFGTASTLIRSGQEVMLFSGLPPFVREGDQFNAMVTVRNGAERDLTLDVALTDDVSKTPRMQRISLKPGLGASLAFPINVPLNIDKLAWTINAKEVSSGKQQTAAQDTLKITQQVGAAVPVRIYQQTLQQLNAEAQTDAPWAFSVQQPAGAIAGRGGIAIQLTRSLAGNQDGLREWMASYPYSCLEQRASIAITLENEDRWNQVMNSLPAHLDQDGLARYFAIDWLRGDDTLTSYLLRIADEAHYSIPEGPRERMLKALEDFVAGRIHRYGSLQSADLTLRKLTAIDALARYERARPAMLESLEISPNLWPSSGVIDWISILQRLPEIAGHVDQLKQARQILQSRLMFSGTTMNFSTEKQDYLWWLMESPDLNAVRALRLLAEDPDMEAADVGRLARGAISRQTNGHWSTTVANAWGAVALRYFQAHFEKIPVAGTTQLKLGEQARSLDWAEAKTAAQQDPTHIDPTHIDPHHSDPTSGTPMGAGLSTHFAWPKASTPLSIQHMGAGKPWAFVTSKAALPLEKPLFAGYRLKRSVTAIEQKTRGLWQRGDTYRVQLEIDAQSDMTWVVVNDPVPAGATILGSGLGGDSSQLAAGEKQAGWQRPAFEERAFDGFRAYYAYVPKGKFSIEYTVRLNNAGRFAMPASRVEAMYAPEIFAEVPVPAMEVKTGTQSR
ncbi:MAG: alpha-2-macroglobulin family protein [Methylophilus sp.]|uniref:alpha-2-macroglobulin family protein n=1 Tax=Methylophilus sp. TaxID=29541 RepID=UPI004037388A